MNVSLKMEKGFQRLSMLLTDLLIANFDVVNAARDQASREAGKRYFRTMDEHTELPFSEN